MTYFSPAPPSACAKPARAVLFDAYGTLFDVHSVADLADDLYPGFGHAISLVWRDKQIEYTRLVTTCNHGAYYQPFSALTRAALIYAIKKVAASAHETCARAEFLIEHEPAIEMLMAQYQHLDAFPENLAVLQQLKTMGVPTGILSNGDPAMLQAAVYSAGMAGLLNHVVSVDAVRTFKTHPLAYALGEQALGRPAAQVLFVSANGWDALGATWYGYQTLWVNRAGLPFEELGCQPSHTASSLDAVLQLVQP